MAVPTDELTRLSTGAPTGYNNDPFNASTNPYGFADGGYITNFFAALTDLTVVTTWAADEIAPIADLSDEIADLGAIVADLQALAGVIPNISALAALSTQITALGAITTAISTVATNAAAVSAVSTDIAKVAAVNAALSNISAVAAAISNIDAVVAMAADIATVSGIASDIATLADIEDGTDATGAIQAVAAIATELVNVAGNADDVVAVAGALADVNTVAGIATAVSALGPIADDVSAVADISSDVTSVADNMADVIAAPAAAEAARKSVRHIIFDSGTADAHPGSGHFRLSIDINAASIGATGTIYHDIVDADGGDQTGWVNSWDDVVNTTGRGNLEFVCEGDPSISAVLRITSSVSSGSGYRKANFTLLNKSLVGGNFADEMEFTETFGAYGNDGGGSGGGITVVGSVAAGEIAQFSDNSGNFVEGSGKTTGDFFDLGANDLDDIADGSTKVSFTATERTKLSGIEASADVTDAGNVGAVIHAATGKSVPVDNDEFALIDSAASNVLKKVTWANLKATLKTYLDTLYSAAAHTHALTDITGRVAAYASDILGLTGKTTPIDADLLALVDTADSNALKKLTWANVKANLWSSLGALIAAGTGKSTPVDADTFALADSAASSATKKVAFSDLKTTLGSTFHPLAKGYIVGLKLSNNVTDSTNDIDTGPGEATLVDASGNRRVFALGSTLVKRLDATWAAGTNQGGLDTGSKANSTSYAMLLIGNPSTGATDVLFTVAPGSSPTLPSGYTFYRYIGSVQTNGSGVLFSFLNRSPGHFSRTTKSGATNLTAGTTDQLQAFIELPSGRRVLMKFAARIFNASFGVVAYVSSPDETDQAPTFGGSSGVLGNIGTGATNTSMVINGEVWTDTSRQVRYEANGNSTTLDIAVLGWFDPEVVYPP